MIAVGFLALETRCGDFEFLHPPTTRPLFSRSRRPHLVGGCAQDHVALVSSQFFIRISCLRAQRRAMEIENRDTALHIVIFALRD